MAGTPVTISVMITIFGVCGGQGSPLTNGVMITVLEVCSGNSSYNQCNENGLGCEKQTLQLLSTYGVFNPGQTSEYRSQSSRKICAGKDQLREVIYLGCFCYFTAKFHLSVVVL